MAITLSIGPYTCINDTKIIRLTYLWAAHTISQRLRTLRKIPPELMPLGKLVLSRLIRIPLLIRHIITGVVLG